jgi:hypothetical protein
VLWFGCTLSSVVPVLGALAPKWWWWSGGIFKRWAYWEVLAWSVNLRLKEIKLFLVEHWLVLMTVTVGHWWLMSIILATPETEIRRIMAWSQPWQIVPETLSQKKKTPKAQKPHHKKFAGGVAKGVGPELKPQYWKKKDNYHKILSLAPLGSLTFFLRSDHFLIQWSCHCYLTWSGATT